MPRFQDRMKKLVLLTLVVSQCGRCFSAGDPPTPRHLSLREAQELAVKQHPKISVANLLALAAQQVTREARSALYPTVVANATAAGNLDPNRTRVVAGQLNNPTLFDRQADGANVYQLITDFGRTWDLAKSAKLREKSEQMNAAATRAQILLEVNNAYFTTLESQSVLEVAKETVRERKLVLDRTSALATNKMKSELDVSFARVDLSQAGILLAKASNDLEASFAALSAVLGESRPESFELTDEPLASYVTNNDSALIQEALQQRPDLTQLRYQRQASEEFAQAERKLDYPSINAVGAAGIVPIGNSQLAFDDAAAGVNISIPFYTGGLDAARRREARLRARAAEEAVRDEEDTIARDVKVAILNLDYAHQRLELTEELLRNAKEALELSRAQFNVGASSIIELSQAELNATSAEIAEADARFDYQIRNSALEFALGRLR
jgi:outer membrane protein